MLDIKVTNKGKINDVDIKIQGNLIDLGAEFVDVIKSLVEKHPRIFTPALFIAINDIYTEKEIQERLAKAEVSKTVASILKPVFEARKVFNQKAQYNEQKKTKNATYGNKKPQKKQNKPKVTKFESFEDFIADIEKTIKGE